MKISILVKTGSRVEEVKKVGNIYEIRVKARPVEGKANQEIIRLLSDFFEIPKSRIRIKSGLKSKNKTVELG